MICSMCGQVMTKRVAGNIIDYRHPGVSAECPSQLGNAISMAESWEPAARHYRNVGVL